MKTNRDDQEEPSIDIAAYLRGVNSELMTRTGQDPAAVAGCTAGLDKLAAMAERAALKMVSIRGARSALAAFRLSLGTEPFKVAAMPILSPAEPTSPAAIVDVLVEAAMEGVYEPGTRLTAEDWRRDRRLRVGAVGVFDRFVEQLVAVAWTELKNAEAKEAGGKSGKRSPTEVIEARSVEDLFAREIAGDRGAVAISVPDNMVAVAVGLVMVPPERRPAAAAEIVRYAGLATYRDVVADFGHLVDIAVVIYV